jgi:outer membrane protein TolC
MRVRFLFQASRPTPSRRAYWRITAVTALVVAISLNGAGFSARAKVVKLEEVIAAAADGNLAVRQEEAKVRSAAGTAQEAAGAFDWTPVVQTGWQRLYVPSASNGFLTTGTTSIDAVQNLLRVEHLFRSGISVSPGITIYNNVEASVGQTLGLTKTIPSLGLSIPLWQGLGEESADAAERAARKAFGATSFEQKFVVQHAVHDAVQVYWRCLADREQVDIFQASVRDAGDYAQWLRTIAARGQAESTATERAAADQVIRAVAVGGAKQQFETCRRDLLVATGAPVGADLPMPQGELPSIEALGASVDALNESALTAVALSRREDLRALERFVDAESDRVRGAEDKLSPKLDLYLDTQRAYLRFSRSLHNDGAQGLVTKASAAESVARINASELKSRIQLEISAALHEVRQARVDWSSLSETLRRLEGVVVSDRKQAKAGTIDRATLLASQDQAAQVRHQLLAARLRFALALAALRLASGSVNVEGRAPALVASEFYALPAP